MKQKAPDPACKNQKFLIPPIDLIPRSRSTSDSIPPLVRRPWNRSGQMEISFGMIFSIILIIIFLAFGFYAITKFLDLQKSIQTEKFLSDLQEDINNMWKSPQGSQTITYTLPTNIVSVCFKTDEFQNLEFNSNKIIPGKMIQNIDIASITSQENPYCIPNIKGKVNIVLKKDYGETLVRITR